MVFKCSTDLAQYHVFNWCYFLQHIDDFYKQPIRGSPWPVATIAKG